MTAEVLVKKLCHEMMVLTEHITFHDSLGNKCKLHVFEQTLPRKSSEEDPEPFPYCVVKFDNSKVTNVGERQPVDIVLDFGIYYDNPDCQYQHTFHQIFEKIKGRFLDNNFLGSFRCEPEMAFALSPEDEITYPYYYAAVAMKWMIPGYERKDVYS